MDTLSQIPAKTARKYQRHSRAYQAETLNKMRSCSQRNLAQKEGIARSTFRHWQERVHALQGKADPLTVQFFESPSGQEFLQVLYPATLLVFHQYGNCSLPAVEKFFSLIGTDRFVASSISSLRRIDQQLGKLIIAYGKEETERLAKTMPHKYICCAVDENYILDELTLVAIEPGSNFILTEQLAEDRTAETWNIACREAFKNFNITVQQFVGDEAAGLIKLATHHFKVIKGPDLFHIQQEITRGVTSPIARSLEQARHAKEVLQKEAVEVLGKLTEQVKSAGSIERLSKRGTKAAQRLCNIGNEEKKNDKCIKLLEERKEAAKMNRKAISNAYHPFHPETGKKQSPEQVKKELETSFQTLEKIADDQKLSEKQKEKLQKGKGLIGSMMEVLLFFFALLAACVKDLQLTEDEVKTFEKLVAYYYWGGRIRKTPGKESKDKVRGLVKQLEEDLDRDPIWRQYEPERRTELIFKAKESAEKFQRSSSCVEGRNGQFSLKFHAFRHLTPKALQILTILHNFFASREDGSTAAERFFNQKPRDLFTCILHKVELPRPRTVRRNGKSEWKDVKKAA